MSDLDFTNCSLEEMWKKLAAYLKSKNIDSVLVGGGVATIYSQGQYMSGDLDFVMGWGNSHKQIQKALEEIGFFRTGTIYRHPQTTFSLDFSSPPVDIGLGNDPEINEEIFDGQRIQILSPTECVKDRLNKYVHFKDQSAMQAALAVANKTPIALERIKQFCKENNFTESFDEFIRQLRKR